MRFKDLNEAQENINNPNPGIRRKARHLLNKQIKRLERIERMTKTGANMVNCGLQQPQQKVIDRNLKYLANLV